MMMTEILKSTLPRVCFLLLGSAFAAFFMLFLITGITASFNAGNAAGMALSGFFAFVFLFPSVFLKIVCGIWGHSTGRLFLIFAALFAVICAVLAAVISVLMIKAADRPPEEPVTAIVLGCRVKAAGPSLMLEKRIEAAYEYLSENPAAMCIASGGKGDDEPLSEAECIRDGLVTRGISPERIILEDRSTNTCENIRNSLEIMDSLEMKRSAVIITSEFHQLRAAMISEKQGLEAYSISSRTYPPLLPSYWIREWFAAAYEWVKK